MNPNYRSRLLDLFRFAFLVTIISPTVMFFEMSRYAAIDALELMLIVSMLMASLYFFKNAHDLRRKHNKYQKLKPAFFRSMIGLITAISALAAFYVPMLYTSTLPLGLQIATATLILLSALTVVFIVMAKLDADLSLKTSLKILFNPYYNPYSSHRRRSLRTPRSKVVPQPAHKPVMPSADRSSPAHSDRLTSIKVSVMLSTDACEAHDIQIPQRLTEDADVINEHLAAEIRKFYQGDSKTSVLWISRIVMPHEVEEEFFQNIVFDADGVRMSDTDHAFVYLGMVHARFYYWLPLSSQDTAYLTQIAKISFPSLFSRAAEDDQAEELDLTKSFPFWASTLRGLTATMVSPTAESIRNALAFPEEVKVSLKVDGRLLTVPLSATQSQGAFAAWVSANAPSFALREEHTLDAILDGMSKPGLSSPQRSPAKFYPGRQAGKQSAHASPPVRPASAPRI